MYPGRGKDKGKAMTDLMMNQLNMSVSWLRDFNDEGLHFILMFLALIYILISKK